MSTAIGTNPYRYSGQTKLRLPAPTRDNSQNTTISEAPQQIQDVLVRSDNGTSTSPTRSDPTAAEWLKFGACFLGTVGAAVVSGPIGAVYGAGVATIAAVAPEASKKLFPGNEAASFAQHLHKAVPIPILGHGVAALGGIPLGALSGGGEVVDTVAQKTLASLSGYFFSQSSAT